MIKKRIMAITLFSTIIGLLPIAAYGSAFPAHNTAHFIKPTHASVESIIEAGLSYLGTPYEFGSSRSNTTTFDCSDFVRQVFLDGIDITLPSDSRKQGAYVRELHSEHVITQWRELERGDLMFFMSYKGSSPSDYTNIDWSTERITHVGIYLGNDEILHTFSEESGGVKINKMTEGKWNERFLFGGSAILE